MITFNDDTRSFDATHTAVAFPLGGIGTGNVSLGARGELRDWEIFNQPNKGYSLPNTFFAIRTQIGRQEPVARVLEGPLPPPHTLSHGYHPITNAGLPRCARTIFRGEYPFAQIDFHDPHLPVAVRLEAFTPLIPLNPEDSGIPCAVLTYHVTNTSAGDGRADAGRVADQSDRGAAPGSLRQPGDECRGPAPDRIPPR